MKRSPQSMEILLVEDNEADIELTRQGFQDARLSNKLHVVRNGHDALDFVFQGGAYADAPRPDLILLDMNLPGLSGPEVLKALKADARSHSIPVVILTTSSREADINAAYLLQASSFITKPVRFEEFLDVVHHVSAYWFEVVRLPAPPPVA